MNAHEIIADLKRQQVEILTEERLLKVIAEVPKPTTYIGFEPSGVLHIGHLSSSIPVIKLAKHGFRAIILLADLHALANDKGEMREIQDFATYDRKVFEKIATRLGAGGKFEYKLGTQFEDQSYFIQLLRLAKLVNFTEAEKSMDEISRATMTRMTSSVIYPLMQALDIGVLGVHVAVGGFAQRKVHVLAIENLKKLGYVTPIAIHSGAVIGTDGKELMSKTRGNTINMDETQDSLEAKIKKTYCAPGDIEVNPILSWYKTLLFPLIESPVAFGEKTASDYVELEELWAKREITPQQFKAAAVRDLANLLIS
ncbi:MAG: tyrosine--tRNA ligase [Nitrososphaerota archaeon]|nr:tyrosine--tRNA ligase [Nitrososphaerota archaeon]